MWNIKLRTVFTARRLASFIAFSLSTIYYMLSVFILLLALGFLQFTLHDSRFTVFSVLLFQTTQP